MKVLSRVYDNVDMLMLRALLAYEGCPEALYRTSRGWGLHPKKGRNLLYHPPGDLDWVHDLTVPLWNQVIGVAGAEWSEEALRHVAKTLLLRGSLIEVELPELLQGKAFLFEPQGSITDNFPSSEIPR